VWKNDGIAMVLCELEAFAPPVSKERCTEEHTSVNFALENPPEDKRSYSNYHGSNKFSMLNTELAWSTLPKDGEWAQLDLGRLMVVTAVVTQAHYAARWSTGGFRVLSYKVKFSTDGSTWSDVDEGATFKGNNYSTDTREQVEGLFASNVVARYVQVWPLTWRGWPSMRFGVKTNVTDNVALHKPVTSSSMASNGHAFKLTDGNDDGGVYRDSPEGHCAHTISANPPSWFKVDLGCYRTIGSVALFGRTGFDHQTQGLMIRIGDTGSAIDPICKSPVDANTGRKEVTCDSVLSGRYISVWQTNAASSSMVLCELEAFSAPAPSPAATNIALGKPVASSSECWGGYASKLTDGAYTSLSNGDYIMGLYDESVRGTCASTCANAKNWFRVDLGSSHDIESVTVVSRDYGAWSMGMTIRIGASGSESDAICKSNVDADMGEKTTSRCDNVLSGRYISIWKTNDALMLCELQAFAAQ